jgi:hypothetical protein
MKPHFINLVNAIILIVLGGWGYLEKESPTALIPVFIGAYLWIQTPKMRAGDKNASHIVAAVTLLTVIGLFSPLRREMNMEDTMGTLRSITMLGSALFALSVYVKYFMDARRTAA